MRRVRWSVSVRRSRQYRAANRRAALTAASRAFGELVPSYQALLQTVAERVATLTGDACAVRLLSTDGQRLEPMAAHHPDPELRAALWEVMAQTSDHADAGLWRRVEAGQVIRLPLAAQEIPADASAAQAEFIRRYSVRSIVGAPLVARGRILGDISLVRYRYGCAHTAEDEAILRDLAGRAALAIDNARLYQVSEQSRAETELAEQRLRFLAEASSELARSLDYETTLQAVARLAVPFLADRCMVDVVEDGVPRRVAVACADPARHELAQQLLRFPPDAETDEGPSKVLRTGRSEIYPEITEARLPRFVRNQEHLQIVQQLGVRAHMIVALRARERTLGVITFVSAESGRTYGAAELALAEELARRAALAIDNARLYAEARQAIAVRDQFLAVASHELKTPAAVISGYLQVLNRQLTRTGGLEPELLVRSLRAMGHQVERLSRLIEQLLDISRHEVGKLSLKPESIDLVELARRAVADAQARTARRCITLQAPSSLPIRADPLRLEQVLTNLLGNAARYSPEGEPIEVEVDGPTPDFARVAIRDHGIGIPPEKRDRIFERFYRAHDDSYQSGLGLGLFISRQIVDLHGGKLWAEYPEDGGSRFVVQLPLRPRDHAAP